MKNPIEKAFYLGVCAASVAKNFIEDEVSRALKAGNITEAEGKKIVKDFHKQMKSDSKEFKATARKHFKKALHEAKPLVKEGTKMAKDLAKSVVTKAKLAKKKVVKRKAPKKKAKKKSVKKKAKRKPAKKKTTKKKAKRKTKKRR